LVALTLGLLIAAAYAPVVNVSFLSDDWAIIRLIIHPEAVTNWTEILRDFYSPLFFHDGSPFYRPMYTLSYGVDFWLFGTSTFGYHVTNLAIHFVSAFFVYLIALELVGGVRRFGIAVTAGAIFALYPIHSEAITWIAERVDLLVAAFYLPAVYLFLRWLRSGGVVFPMLSLACFTLALASKEMAVTLPVVLFLCALYRRQSLRRSVIRVLPFALMLGAYLLFRAYILSGVDAYGVVGRDLRPLGMLQGALYRTGHLVFPLNPELLPAGWRGFLDPALMLLPVLIVMAAVAAYYFGGARSSLPLVLTASYLVALAPVLKALRPDPDLSLARWSYLPVAFVAILIAFLVWTAMGWRPRLGWALSALVCAAFLALLTLNNGPWIRAGEMAERILEEGTKPDMPLDYKGAHVFGSRITWLSANLPPFKERP
jgi:hypothetical protein